MDASDVTVAILNYDGRDLLAGLLPTLASQTAQGFEVNVIDNGSSDGSVSWLAREWPQVEVIQIPENIGVTRALNRAVLSAQTPYVALLNNDLELEPRWLEEMRGALEAHPCCGSADGKLLNFHRRGEIDGAGDLVARTGECSKRGFGEQDRGQFDRAADILCASGGAALYRRAAFDRVGAFDEDFGAYYEDTDWGLRAQLCGYGCRYVPTAVAFHMGSATTGRNRAAYAHLFSRNSLLMLVKCLPAASLVRLGPLVLAFQLKWLAASARNGRLRAHLRGWRGALALLPATLSKRREVQSRRTLSSAGLREVLTPVNWRLEQQVARDDAGSATVPPSVPVQDAETRVCPLCGGGAELSFTAVDRNREITAQPFRYRQCKDCATYSLVDVPLDLGPFYPADYYDLPDVAALEEMCWVEEHKLARIRGHVPSGRLVEIGPGPGVFAYAAQRAGYGVTVIEMDARAGRHLREEVGVATITSADPAAALARLPTANVVVMWHVIEHLPNPWEVVAAAAERLEPGGALVIAAPNPDALQFRLLKARWAHVDAPRHLFLLPLRTLSERCAALGLRQAAVTTADPAGRHWNRFGWEYAARRRPAAGPAPRPLALAALAVTLAMRPVEHSGLRGAAYTAVYVKR